MEVSNYFYAVRSAGCSRVRYLAVFKKEEDREKFVKSHKNVWRRIKSVTDISVLLQLKRPILAGDLSEEEQKQLYSLFA